MENRILSSGVPGEATLPRLNPDKVGCQMPDLVLAQNLATVVKFGQQPSIIVLTNRFSLMNEYVLPAQDHGAKHYPSDFSFFSGRAIPAFRPQPRDPESSNFEPSELSPQTDSSNGWRVISIM